MDKRPRILIVDDIPSNIKTLNEILMHDYQISVATNGEEALKIAAQENFVQLILLDIMMPAMDGYEVCRQLQAHEVTAGIPVIFVSAMGEVQDETRGLELGAVDFITKPVSPPIVKARVRTHLRLKQQQDQLKSSISRMEHKAEIGIQAGGLAHDINNILAACQVVEFVADMLPKDFPEKAEALECLDLALANLRTGQEICQGYTNYLHDLEDEPKVQPLEPLLKPLDMFARKYKGELVQEVAPGLPPIRCKGHQLKRVIVNLFMNAWQAVAKQKEQLIVLRLWGADGRVFFSLADNGPGIPADVRPHIFEEGFSTKESGTGLGLYLTRQIVDRHNGTIEVTAGEPRGTVFTLSFPVANS